MYVRKPTPDWNFQTSLVIAKTRVAPIKGMTIPRLELNGALITARLCHYVQEAPIQKPGRIVGWTYSTTVLHWIQGPSGQYKQYVANLVNEIQDLIDPQCWRYCPTEDNPADLSSRGIKVNQLKTSRKWWSGPNWLSQSEDHCPKDLKTAVNIPEERKVPAMTVHTSLCTQTVINPSRYSSLKTLLRVTSYVMRFIRNAIASRDERVGGPITKEEIVRANLLWLKWVQEEVFVEELKALKASEDLLRKSKLNNLSSFLDENTGLIKVGGRIQKASLPEQTKNPVILPHQHEFVYLLIQDIHERNLHAGNNQTLTASRQAYWIIQGRSTVKKVINRCRICSHFKAKAFTQKMAPLPKE